MSVGQSHCFAPRDGQALEKSAERKCWSRWSLEIPGLFQSLTVDKKKTRVGELESSQSKYRNWRG